VESLQYDRFIALQVLRSLQVKYQSSREESSSLNRGRVPLEAMESGSKAPVTSPRLLKTMSKKLVPEGIVG